MHPLHDVEIGEACPQIVNCIIEIPADSKTKFELDKATGLLRVDRVLYSSVHYPHSYGFIPKTHCDDGDPLDILVIGQARVYPLCIMRAKPIGFMRMIDQGKLDDKIIAVHADDPEFQQYNEIRELPPHLLTQIRNFFENYKELEGKSVTVEDFKGRDAAFEVV
jgi:inorganic pyrophosphatase